ncbi:hypothetical protein ZWY2020_024023 [Hordeum vulgare]|nr:hypothetical protein ZWY2020_024023 [Hordeum vulgare]
MGGEPVAVSAVIPEALGKSEERALILGWVYCSLQSELRTGFWS